MTNFSEVQIIPAPWVTLWWWLWMKSGKHPCWLEDWFHNGFFFFPPIYLGVNLQLANHWTSAITWSLKNDGCCHNCFFFFKELLKHWSLLLLCIWREDIYEKLSLAFRQSTSSKMRTRIMRAPLYMISIQIGNIIGLCLAAFVTIIFCSNGRNMLNSSLRNNASAFVFRKWFAFGSNASLVWNEKGNTSLGWKWWHL